MASLTATHPSTQRPSTVTAAVVLTVAIAVASVPLMFLPGTDEIPMAAIVFGLVASLVSLVSAWGLWNLRRWGAVVTFIVTLLNTLTSVPAFFDPPSNAILVAVIITTLPQLAVLALIMLSASRRSYA